jgi:hypothetical protein
VDEQRQPEGSTRHAEAPAWRLNGGYNGEDAQCTEGWSPAHPAQGWAPRPAEPPDPTCDPRRPFAVGGTGSPAAVAAPDDVTGPGPGSLAGGGAVGTAPAGPATGGQARHRQPAPGLDDDTPPSGLPTIEPPLWREAVRSAPPLYGSYSPPHPDYQPAPPTDVPTPPAGPPGGEPPNTRAQPVAPAGSGPPVEPAGAAATGGTELAGLPQRVPAEPDVPVTAEPDPAEQAAGEAAGREAWTAPELAWIADQLRRDDVPAEAPADPFDVDAVVAAVREVAGVHAASVRGDPATGMHTLRLDLAEDADPGQVSRKVARLLLERMGLTTAPPRVPQASVAAPPRVPHARTSEEGTRPAGGGGWRPPTPESRRGEPPTAEPPTEPPMSEPPMSEPPTAPTATEPQTTEPPTAEPTATGWRAPAGPPEPAAPPPPGGVATATEPSWQWPEPSLSGRSLPELEAEPPAPEPVSRPLYTSRPGPRVLIDQVQVSTYGLEATVEVQLTAGDRQASGVASGPAADSYLVRLAAVAAAKAIDVLLREVAEPGGPSRCFVEHTGVVAFGSTEVAVAVVLLVCGGWVEQLSGSALVDGDPRQAVVRATLGAVNRRLEALLA